MSVSFKFQSDSINTFQQLQAEQKQLNFKFQSDSINTHSPTCFTHVCFTLNSNLILLIRRLLRSACCYIKTFKFQSDSINTEAGPAEIQLRRVHFKFQSDSINTGISIGAGLWSQSPLNSNLILLILIYRTIQLNTYHSLNSNLILLIPIRLLFPISGSVFKFQSDSINTKLNIPLILWSYCFKFQSDSINTVKYLLIMPDAANFKFQSDSINTVYNHISYKQVMPLNSNLILLIRMLRRHSIRH